ncbi:hypothetical protein I7I48_05224 [Histoplasma ohiense]|nr:hypothetical protein I7I48_05224 [Histoplasma ohiense (nom. inval.)]
MTQAFGTVPMVVTSSIPRQSGMRLCFPAGFLSRAQRFSVQVPNTPTFQNYRAVFCLSTLNVTCNSISNSLNRPPWDLHLALINHGVHPLFLFSDSRNRAEVKMFLCTHIYARDDSRMPARKMESTWEVQSRFGLQFCSIG